MTLGLRSNKERLKTIDMEEAAAAAASKEHHRHKHHHHHSSSKKRKHSHHHSHSHHRNHHSGGHSSSPSMAKKAKLSSSANSSPFKTNVISFNDSNNDATSSLLLPPPPPPPPLSQFTTNHVATTEVFPSGDPTEWNCEQVFEFVKQVAGPNVAYLFRSQEVDGSALSLIRDDHLVNTMQIKLGPALKIMSKFNELTQKFHSKNNQVQQQQQQQQPTLMLPITTQINA
jgi:hypothetical protein